MDATRQVHRHFCYGPLLVDAYLARSHIYYILTQSLGVVPS